MKIAIITGASSGLGEEFAKQAVKEFPEIECFWLVARREDRLQALAATLGGKQTRILPLDLCRREHLDLLEQELQREQPEVALLINNAG